MARSSGRGDDRAMHARPDAERQRGLHVLVAEDDDAIRFLLVTVLRATGGVAEVVEAADGAEAVELGRSRRFDVAVLDLDMPRAGGLEAAAGLRALQPWLEIALQSGDLGLLHERAAWRGGPLFDKANLERLFDWVGRRAEGSHEHGSAGELVSRSV